MDTINEILIDLNKDITSISKHKDNGYLRIFLEHALIPEKKFLLPEGNPPYTPKAGLSHVETKGTAWQEVRKFGTYVRKDIKAIRLETLFIQAVENVDEVTANIFIAVKDQTLSDLFPNVTRESLNETGYKL